MGYKLEGASKRYRGRIIVVIILWLVLTIVFVCPLASAIGASQAEGGELLSQTFFTTFGECTANPLVAIGKALSYYSSIFFKIFGGFTLVYALFVLMGFLRSMPNNEYTDIEHGSSDWSVKGEQYRILSPNNGIILAQNNYLPVDKIGNVNVLVVRRFRFSENHLLMLYQTLINA